MPVVTEVPDLRLIRCGADWDVAIHNKGRALKRGEKNKARIF